MEQPRQGTSAPKIIDDPKLRSSLRKYVEGSATIVLWMAWIYLVAPVLTLLLWIFGVHIIYESFFPKHGLWELYQVLRRAGLSLLVIFMLNIVWIFYNIKFASRYPKKTKKHTENPYKNTLMAPAGKNNRIEVSLEDEVPRILSVYFLEKK